MALTKLSFAAFCCFIAQTMRVMATDGDAELASLPVQQNAAAPRTLRQEFFLLLELMEEWEFKLTELRETQVIAAKQDLASLANKAINEFFTLNVKIFSDQDLFTEKTPEDPSLPKYRGVKRYSFVKALVYSMAKKFKAMDNYLKDETSNKSTAYIKRQLIKLNFAKKMEFKKLPTVERIVQLVEDFFAAEAPITTLLELIISIEAALKKEEKENADPFAEMYNEYSDGDGDELQEVDKIALAEAEKTSFIPVPQQENEDALIIDLEPLSTGEQAVDGRSATQPTVDLRVPASRESTSDTSAQLPPVQPSQPQPAVSEVSGSGDAETGVTVPGSTSADSSLRQDGDAQTTQKPSSAFDSFVTAILFVSIAFAL